MGTRRVAPGGFWTPATGGCPQLNVQPIETAHYILPPSQAPLRHAKSFLDVACALIPFNVETPVHEKLETGFNEGVIIRYLAILRLRFYGPPRPVSPGYSWRWRLMCFRRHPSHSSAG